MALNTRGAVELRVAACRGRCFRDDVPAGIGAEIRRRLGGDWACRGPACRGGQGVCFQPHLSWHSYVCPQLSDFLAGDRFWALLSSVSRPACRPVPGVSVFSYISPDVTTSPQM